MGATSVGTGQLKYNDVSGRKLSARGVVTVCRPASAALGVSLQAMNAKISTNLRFLEMQGTALVRITRSAAWCLGAVAVLLGCASQPQRDAGSSGWVPHVRVATDPAACRDMLDSREGTPESGLDASDIRIVNWNMQKVRHTRSVDDLDALAGDTDLILIQEAALQSELLEPFENARFWSFAPGYRSGDKLTGVMTMSASMPLTRCSLTSWEPWLGTPKATSITEYSLEGTDETLVVANIHAVNFTVGTRRFRDQLEQIATVLGAHEGPVILSGDFNTWRQKRVEVVDEIVARLRLTPVEFDDDRRKIAFGQVLDHVYARGLSHVESSTRMVSTSDHNPMIVRFTRFPELAK